jgi:hypothetical protein
VTCFSISGLAFASLGNLAAGKLKVRSSVSSTQTRLSSIQHRMACGASVSNSAIAMKTTISFDQKSQFPSTSFRMRFTSAGENP